jgi:hypothetical protein
MKKPSSTTIKDDVWNDTAPADETIDTEQDLPSSVDDLKPQRTRVELEFDLEGLMTDFPTAKELEKFVYDQTGIALNLKGRANKLKYQVAMDVLNGISPGEEFTTKENPYLDKNELIPEEPLPPVPARDAALPPPGEMQNLFHSKFVPHPDPEMRAIDAKVTVCFRKYKNGMISYEIEGPLEKRNWGEKVDKFGRSRPEIVKWLDPRSGEQLMRRQDGSMTYMGQRLKALMQKHRVWDRWIDREFVGLAQDIIDNPWGNQ